MKNVTRTSSPAVCLALLLGALGFHAGTANADTSLDDAQVQGAFQNAPVTLTGTIDRMPANGRTLIVDDTLLTLDNVVSVNGQSWSRERLMGQLEEGMTIRFELKQGPAGRLPIIIALQVGR